MGGVSHLRELVVANNQMEVSIILKHNTRPEVVRQGKTD